jgi:hypothetical protein
MSHNVERVGEVAVFVKLMLHFLSAVDLCYTDEISISAAISPTLCCTQFNAN